MKKLFIIGISLCAIFALGSCKTAKKEKSPIETYVMPCSEHISKDGVLRAWASGASDNESTARKKALASASAELAAMLTKTVETTTEEYSTVLAEGNSGISKSFLNEKSKITVNKVLSGATIVCDRWNKSDDGQYTNYIVLELKGEEYLKALYEELSKNNSSSVDKELLEKLFMQNIKDINK